MRAFASVAAAAVLAALVYPELPRYAAERRVGMATAAFRELVQKEHSPDAVRGILSVGEIARSAAPQLPGDPRPWMVAASSFLITGAPDRALELYREGFATGERAEIDLNLGRAYALLNKKGSAAAAFLRAGWVNPEILSSLPDSVQNPLRGEIARLAEQLAQGRLAAPPPLPEDERR
ncbi:MAG: hypothetical protein ABI968_04490 [Acidobacteriota bacterium]